MKWNNHWKQENQHAFLGASKCSWLNYDDEKLISSYQNFKAIEEGTELHAIAANLINHKIELPNKKKTLNLYVNDGIKYNMSTEVILYYADVCFGTTDAISFNNNILRIHDLKTGVSKAHMEQLQIYASLFCLEYGIDPYKINIILQLYQSNLVIVDSLESDPEIQDTIKSIMNQIEHKSEYLSNYLISKEME